MIRLNGNSLTIQDVVSVARRFGSVEMDAEAEKAVVRSRRYVDKILQENRVVYGITTGVGELANQFISAEDSGKLQLNLVRSHATNVGNPFPEDVVRGVILLRANTLAKGFSGVRLEVVQQLIEFLNHRIHPYIPSQGSVGASGDLSPLSHLALTLIGEGECIVDGKRTETEEVLRSKNLQPLALKSKEGLALINGTQVMAAIGCLVLHEAMLLVKNAQIAGAMSLEALKGTSKASVRIPDKCAARSTCAGSSRTAPSSPRT
jgi:histidine ammonia-lyase